MKSWLQGREEQNILTNGEFLNISSSALTEFTIKGEKIYPKYSKVIIYMEIWFVPWMSSFLRQVRQKLPKQNGWDDRSSSMECIHHFLLENLSCIHHPKMVRKSTRDARSYSVCGVHFMNSCACNWIMIVHDICHCSMWLVSLLSLTWKWNYNRILNLWSKPKISTAEAGSDF